MTRILGISGSLRAGSFNTALLRTAASMAPAGVQMEVATLHGIPLYDADMEEREGLPAAVQALKEKVLASDGVILSTPEYNNSVPGVFKNGMDWLSRPPEDIPKVFAGRVWAMMGATPSGFATLLAQNAWLSVLRHVGAPFWSGGRILLSRAGQAFSDGRLTDEAAQKQVKEFVAGFAAHLAQRK